MTLISESLNLLGGTINPSYDGIRSEANFDDDAVTVGLKSLGGGFIISVLMWTASYVLVMFQVVNDGHLIPLTSLLFIPMWAGSLYGIYTVVTAVRFMCKNGAVLVTNEQRLFMRARGISSRSYMNFESLPLMRRLLFWSSLFAIFMILALTTQVLFYLWLIEGVIGMWHALAPVITITILLMSYLFLVRTLSIPTFLTFAALFTDLVLYAMKCHSDVLVTWTVVAIPAIIVESLWLLHILVVTVRAFAGKYLLTRRQFLSLVGYTAAIALALTAETMVIRADRQQSFSLNSLNTSSSSSPSSAVKYAAILWIPTGVIFIASALGIIDQELHRLARTKGFVRPMPLARTQLGWVPMRGYKEVVSQLLGTIDIRSPVVQVPRRRRWGSTPSVIPSAATSINGATAGAGTIAGEVGGITNATDRDIEMLAIGDGSTEATATPANTVSQLVTTAANVIDDFFTDAYLWGTQTMSSGAVFILSTASSNRPSSTTTSNRPPMQFSSVNLFGRGDFTLVASAVAMTDVADGVEMVRSVSGELDGGSVSM